MADTIKVYLAASAEDSRAAEGTGIPGAWLFYRIGESGALQRAAAPISGKGGVMGLRGGEHLEAAEPARLARDIFMECSRRGLRGVLLDFDADIDTEKLTALCAQFAQKQMPYFVSPGLLGAAPGAKIVVSSALSGGSFEAMLSEYSARFGADNLCLEIVRMCHDFTMPSYSPSGVQLSGRQFNDIVRKANPTPYFSPEMQCKYFTYSLEGEAHFLLFDDPDTAAGKIDAAQRAGFYGAFLLYSEWGAQAKQIVG